MYETVAPSEYISDRLTIQHKGSIKYRNLRAWYTWSLSTITGPACNTDPATDLCVNIVGMFTDGCCLASPSLLKQFLQREEEEREGERGKERRKGGRERRKGHKEKERRGKKERRREGRRRGEDKNNTESDITHLQKCVSVCSGKVLMSDTIHLGAVLIFQQ